ncbi:hypothetical protein GCM10011610_37610 [Nocardia rhizosphaerihabitans]|uniref:Uncharacterized protein n=1 Tax=Nocardia rhizosphaerihabitans TaxID=1691570 RepID=A0ABQ2KIB5_9NOCA|nr:hypothetical protein GCM10011610_37610 [Nocardia rhizosphaerihabitans]
MHLILNNDINSHFYSLRYRIHRYYTTESVGNHLVSSGNCASDLLCHTTDYSPRIDVTFIISIVIRTARYDIFGSFGKFIEVNIRIGPSAL